jgi:hypothetical protein
MGPMGLVRTGTNGLAHERVDSYQAAKWAGQQCPGRYREFLTPQVVQRGGSAGESKAAELVRAPRLVGCGVEVTALATLAGWDLSALPPSPVRGRSCGQERRLSKTPYAAVLWKDLLQCYWARWAGAWRSAQTVDTRVANLQPCNPSLPTPSGLSEQPLETCRDFGELLTTLDLVPVHGRARLAQSCRPGALLHGSGVLPRLRARGVAGNHRNFKGRLHLRWIRQRTAVSTEFPLACSRMPAKNHSSGACTEPTGLRNAATEGTYLLIPQLQTIPL